MLFVRSFDVNTDENFKSHHVHLSWQWRHIDITTSQITGNSTVSLTNRPDQHYLPFVGEIYRWPAYSPDKGQVMQKTFSYSNVFMLREISVYGIPCTWYDEIAN